MPTPGRPKLTQPRGPRIPAGPPPPPNPPGAPPRWYLVEYHHAWVDGTLHISLKTDVESHLWLHWTDQPMRTHMRSDFDSGVGWLWAPQYCFVQSTAVEQNEPGDTFWHTFQYAGWAVCNWRWWMFAGTIDGERSPSASPIFNAHYETFQEDESMRHIDLTDKQPGEVIDHADDSILPVKLKYPFTFTEMPLTPAEAPTQDYHVANKKYVDDAAGAGLWVPIETKVFVGTTIIDFSGIPSGYAILRLDGRTRRISAGTSVITAQFNGDTTNAYHWTNIALGPTYVRTLYTMQNEIRVAIWSTMGTWSVWDCIIPNGPGAAPRQGHGRCSDGQNSLFLFTWRWDSTPPEITSIRLTYNTANLLTGQITLSGLVAA